MLEDFVVVLLLSGFLATARTKKAPEDMWNYKLEHSAQTEDQCNELVGGRQPLVLQGLDCHQKNVAHGADGLNRTEGADLESLVAYNDAQGVEDASDYSAPKQVETEVIFHPVDDRPDQLDDIDKQYGIE